MALSTTTNTISYTGDGVTTVFALPYLTFSTTHVFVSVNGNPVTSGFTVSALPAEGGLPNVTFTVAPVVGAVILLQRIVPETQTSVYTVAGPFPAKATEKNLDLLMMAVQQKTTQITNISSLLSSLPSATDPNNLGKGIKVKEDGTGYSTFVINTFVGGGGGGGGTASVLPWGVHNLSLVTSVAANAWTVAFKTQAGTDPSALDPIIIKFPGAGGTYTVQTLTAPMSFTIPSTATIGSVNGMTTRIYIGLALDGSTLRPFVYNALNRASLFPGQLNNAVHNPLVESASYTIAGIAPGSNTAHIIYSNTTVVSPTVRIRILGFADSENATAGTWTSAGTPVLLTPFVPASGSIMRRAYVRDNRAQATANVVPFDNTIPQSGEGLLFHNPTFIQAYKANVTSFSYGYNAMANGACVMSTSGFLNSETDAFMATAQEVVATTVGIPMMMVGQAMRFDIPAGSHSFNVRLGTSTGAILRVNATTALLTGYFGGTATSWVIVEELMV